MMLLTEDNGYPTPATLAAVIANSQIVIAADDVSARRLPAGFDDVDFAVLEWNAEEGRRLGRNFARM